MDIAGVLDQYRDGTISREVAVKALSNRRERLPVERKSITKKIRIGDLEGYVIVGLYPDGRPGEISLIFNKLGSAERGWAQALSVAISLGLQVGLPIKAVAGKLRGIRFDPAGFTGDKVIHSAKSVVDFLAQWLTARFPDGVAE